MRSRTLEVTVIILAAIFLAGLGYALWEFIQVERNTEASTAALAETLTLTNQALKGKHANGDDGILFQLRITLQNAAAAANALKQTAQDANFIAKAQKDKTGALTDASVALVRSGNDAVAKLGSAADQLSGVVADVRTETLPKLNTGVDSLNGLVGDLRPTARASTDLMVAATGDVTALHGVINTANGLLADPDLTAIAHNINLTSANANIVAGNLGLVTMDVHNMLNPRRQTFWETLATTAARSVLGSAAGPIVSHYFPLGINISNSPTITTTPAK